MHIHKAVKEAIETNRNIIRTDTVGGLPRHLSIKPTNSYGHCMTGKHDGFPGGKNWQPSESDLTADSWEVVD